MKKVASSSSSTKKGLLSTSVATSASLPEKPKSIINENIDNNNNTLGLDVPILPSTSTFTLSSTKDDKPEKLKKKAKNFLDERQKIKSRAQSLWSFIGKT
jgi:hypothetical protein